MADPVFSYTQRTDPLRNFKFRVNIQPLTSTATGTAESALSKAAKGIGDIGFAQVSGLSVTNQEITYREGGMNTHPHRFVGQSDFTPVAFARGVFSGQDQLWKWQQFMHAWIGGGVSGGAGLNPGNDEYRCNIIVKVYDHPHNASGTVGTGTNNSGTLRYSYDGGNTSTSAQPIVPGKVKLQYKLFNCWPGSFSLSDLSAGDTTGIMVQTMNVYHEGFYIDWTGEDDLSLVS